MTDRADGVRAGRRTRAGYPAPIADFALVVALAAVTRNSADRMLFWTGCADLVNMSNADLRTWKGRGAGGFICVVQRLSGMGGDQQFTRDLLLSGTSHSLQRYIRDSNVVSRAHKLGMEPYLGFYLSNSLNRRTPLGEWFDDDTWSGTVLPAVKGFAQAAKTLGFDGIAFDQEIIRKQAA